MSDRLYDNHWPDRYGPDWETRIEEHRDPWDREAQPFYRRDVILAYLHRLIPRKSREAYMWRSTQIIRACERRLLTRIIKDIESGNLGKVDDGE